MRLDRIAWLITFVFGLVACGPSREQKAASAEERRVECLDKLCEGDVLPKYDMLNEFPLKLNGSWFIAPRKYGGYGGSFSFLWPSKTPGNSHDAARRAPEFVSSSPVQISNFYDVAIEIFLRSHDGLMHGPSSYNALQIAEAQGRVISKADVHPGLVSWRVKDEIVGLPVAIWYIATDLKDANGEPPVLGCDDQNPKFDRCTMAFIWQPGIAADLRFRATHGPAWPEIYQEVIRVLHLLRKQST